MRQSRHFREQLRRHGFARYEQFHGLEAGLERRVDKVLALGDEQPELVAPASPMKLAHELQRLILRRRDHATHSSQAPW